MALNPLSAFDRQRKERDHVAPHSHADATTTASGFMSPADKQDIKALQDRGQFPDRAALLSWFALQPVGSIPIGYEASDGKVRYRFTGEPTSLTGLSGMEPVGEASPYHFGAVGDGVADDTNAIEAVYDFIGFDDVIDFNGVFRFTRALTFAGVKRPTFKGRNPATTYLMFDGSAVIVNPITFGNNILEEHSWQIENLSFRSKVAVSGAGAHFRLFVRSSLDNVWFGDQTWSTSLPKPTIAVWFDGIDHVKWTGAQARGAHTNVKLNGRATGPKANMFITNGKLGGALVGLHVAGSFGGLYIDGTDIIANTTNILIDRAETGQNNREIFLGAGCLVDSGGTATTFEGICIDVQDTNGWIVLTGTWVASASRLIRIGPDFQGLFTMDGGVLFNAFTGYGGPGYAVEIQRANANITLNGTALSNIQGPAFACTAEGEATGLVLENIRYVGSVASKYLNIATRLYQTFTESLGSESRMGRYALGSATTIVGATDANPKMSVLGLEGGGSTVHIANQNSASAFGSWLELSKGIGTDDVRLNDYLGQIGFSGRTGGSYLLGAQIQARVVVAPTGGARPQTDLLFGTANASGAITNRLALHSDGALAPVNDNAYSLGRSNRRFTEIWALTGTVSTSDIRDKTAAGQVLGLDFINRLEPFSYRWNEKLIGENSQGLPIFGPGERVHWGLSAQQVKGVMDDMDFDFAGWVLTDVSDPASKQALRYEQFIASLIQSIKELTARVEALEA